MSRALETAMTQAERVKFTPSWKSSMPVTMHGSLVMSGVWHCQPLQPSAQRPAICSCLCMTRQVAACVSSHQRHALQSPAQA